MRYPPFSTVHYTSRDTSGDTSGSQAGSWTASADSGGAAIVGASTTAYAVCGSGAGLATTVQVKRVTGPENGIGQPLDVTASCPAGQPIHRGH